MIIKAVAYKRAHRKVKTSKRRTFERIPSEMEGPDPFFVLGKRRGVISLWQGLKCGIAVEKSYD